MQSATEALYYLHTGDPSRPAVVFLHSGGLSCRQWEPQLEQLRDEFYCLAPDLPEQGQSLQIRPFTLRRSADLVASLIKSALPGRKVNVVGLALGGAVALTMMRVVPNLLDSVIVSGTATGMGKVLGGLMLPTDPKFGVMPADQVVKTALTQFGIPEKHRDGLMNDMLRSIEGDFLRSYARELINLALPDRATSPLLVVVGQNEAPAAKQSVRGLVNSIQGSVGVEIANVGHVWNLQQPQLFSDLVQCWVAQRPLPPGIHALI